MERLKICGWTPAWSGFTNAPAIFSSVLEIVQQRPRHSVGGLDFERRHRATR